ncbi:MAG: MBL fold metallo-hydrolase [Acidobacteriota bacterium]
MRVTFLGTGTSRGIPVIGCDCMVCRSENPKNKRLRSSVLIESEASVVIDASVDFRTQMLRHNVRRLDAVLYTHHHVDHILGLDDVYPFNVWSKKALPIYASPSTLREVKITFRHLFSEPRYPGTALLEPFPVGGPFRIGDLEIEPIQVFHGQLPVLGYRLGEFAYLTDVNKIPRASLDQLRGVRYLALDGLRHREHPTHFSLSDAAAMALELRAERTYLIHMCHEVDHDEGNASLPEGVSLAYDGLVWEMN